MISLLPSNFFNFFMTSSDKIFREMNSSPLFNSLGKQSMEKLCGLVEFGLTLLLAELNIAAKSVQGGQTELT
jgi:hypothetical protein